MVFNMQSAFGSLDSRPYFYWLDALLLYVLLAVAALCALAERTSRVGSASSTTCATR